MIIVIRYWGIYGKTLIKGCCSSVFADGPA